ncbi:ABC transporter permease [Streptomyces sp. CHA1]|uniref:ABC transporter permease n=1 Tax=unclassified Streptomyces TaxID=2593676 RepID=UPI001BFC9096|nr:MULTISPECIES: ABC transporter permease [unclassified Streptomyces]MBT3159295.1 ABC transporter permease [Streptomyces sp. G11C]MCO6699669.1 ABC transporter permease [Streptomyces sp. CHB9.2]MCO6705813.1 ABC transporter permease [Streptomyces sp. CHA3]MCO6711515.1 ABC transporter permease [Streptomyces sp. CHB19.2]MCO6717821.1 ABC transporter permease [Streptomyces sp. Vc714c-19]
MTATVPAAPAATVSRPRLLRGLPWLVARQHRATALGVLAAAAVGCALLVQQRFALAGLLDRAGWPAKEVPQPVVGGSLHGYLTLGLSALPVALAVFVGAPLISGDQEQGTAQLVTTQSVTRRQWLLAKLTWCYSLALLAAVPLGLLHTWYWEPHRSLMPHEWIEGAVFDSTGPMLPAFALFLTAVGVAVGLLTRRVFVAMTTTFALALAVEMAWDRVRTELAPSRMFTYPLDTDLPARLSEAYELDRWVGSADGRLYGWGSCAEETEAASEACLREKGIVNDVIEYLGYDQMPAMQWTGAGILLGGTVLLTAFVVVRVGRRPL